MNAAEVEATNVAQVLRQEIKRKGQPLPFSEKDLTKLNRFSKPENEQIHEVLVAFFLLLGENEVNTRVENLFSLNSVTSNAGGFSVFKLATLRNKHESVTIEMAKK